MNAVLESVAAYIPSESVPVAVLGEELGVDRTEVALYRHFFGLDRVRRAPDCDLAGLLVNAASGLPLSGCEHLVRYVLHARAFQAVGPYSDNVLRTVCGKLGLDHAVAFAVTQQGCASGLAAVEIAARLLATDSDASHRDSGMALILTGEKAFTPQLWMLPETTFMGECSAACLVRLGGDSDRLLAFRTRTRGRFYAGLNASAELADEFKGIYLDTLCEVITDAARAAGIELADIALLLPHNVNRISWTRACERLGYPVGRVYLDNVADTGHCFCADPFLNYRHALDRGLLCHGDRYLLVSVGLGATFGAMVFERRQKP